MVLTFLLVVTCLITGTKFVAGLAFTLSAMRVKLGTTGTLKMACNVTEIDACVIYNIQIRRETYPRANYTWETLAEIEAGLNEAPILDDDIVNDKGFVAGGVLDKDTPTHTYLTLNMKKEKLTLSDSRDYRCELTYKSNITGSVASVKRNASLSIVGDDDYNKTQSDIKDNSEYVCKTKLVIVSAILGVTNIVTIVYASYMKMELRKAKPRGNVHASCAKDDRQDHPIQETDDASKEFIS
ncbi:uncharacterized protein LOC128559903 isoform X2 [Mercenaria mercenaria]|uniref:uncharacterized protein LOC128559903 isoform X1 n=1 Tax=Mercenaria mercenaria TaxID=6596 RepID=UPI00234E447F|nr:uncharacterized protein LOC128559903 isoform X1 [Mercenaria mercenaria]XP_053408938.1 uncharacterized protein LOC128559903 isoform X2 [Mercenaria mercenaria]